MSLFRVQADGSLPAAGSSFRSQTQDEQRRPARGAGSIEQRRPELDVAAHHQVAPSYAVLTTSANGGRRGHLVPCGWLTDNTEGNKGFSVV